MADLARVNVSWQNWPGAPGVSTFYFTNTAMQANVDALRAMFNSCAGLLPSLLTITVPGSGDVINDVDGKITGSWSVTTPPTVVTGSAAGQYAGNSGAVIHWLTGSVLGGRRVRGKTYMVPLVSAYEANGSLLASAITTLTNAANTFITAVTPNFRIFVRPVEAHTEYDKKTGQPKAIVGKTGGNYNVSSVRIPDLAVSLRSRRT